jgi:transposase
MVCIKPLMHIMDKPVVRTPRRRREHSAEFKQDLVARSLQPGVSVAAIAMEGGINANLLFEPPRILRRLLRLRMEPT